jgi:hypothetical protein
MRNCKLLGLLVGEWAKKELGKRLGSLHSEGSSAFKRW